MTKSRRQVKQAQRNLPASPAPAFRWRKAYNWIFLLLPLVLGGIYLQQLEQPFPIRSIQLSGTFKHLDQQAVEASLQPYLGQGFFLLDIHQAQQTLSDESWIETVSVRRVWPGSLRVMVEEKTPVARWDGEHLLSQSASVFRADADAFKHLPLVHGDNHPPAWVLQQFYRLQAHFDRVDERLIALQIDSRGALDVELINGLKIKLGRSDIDHKIDRLVSIYRQQILPRREQIKRLDLRYSNGFAVAWKQEVLQGSDKASIWSNGNV